MVESVELFIHVDTTSTSNIGLAENFTGNFVAPIFNGSAPFSVNIKPAYTNVNNRLPPSPVHSFLKVGNVSAIVVSDYEKEFSNPYYTGPNLGFTIPNMIK
jgi:hypothetical protein